MREKDSDIVSEKLDQLVALMIIAFADPIKKHKIEILKKVSEETKLNACKEKPRDCQELPKILGKSPDYVSSYLTLITRETISSSEER